MGMNVANPVAAYPVSHTVDELTVQESVRDVVWSPATRIAFRFCFVYFGLFVLSTQMVSGMIPGVSVPNLNAIGAVRAISLAVGKYVLQISTPILVVETGSGDTLFAWVHAFTLLLIAAIATVGWSVSARGETNHHRLYKWFRLFVRVAVATTMFSYGFAKIVPLQMPVIALSRLVEPFGNFSPMGVLWYSIGAAPAYEIFVGSAEVFAGVLLLFPRTAMFGALVTLMDGIGIFALNMTYDVPVKLFAFHLILFALFLLAPNALVLFRLLVLQQPVTPVPEPLLTASPTKQRNLVWAQRAFCVVAVVVSTYGSNSAWKTYGGGAPKSPLFGVWTVQEMTRDDIVVPPLANDSTRWKHVIFQQPTSARFQRMNEHFKNYTVVIDTTAKSINGTAPDSTKSVLQFTRPSPTQLMLDGTMDGQKVHLQLALRSMDEFLIKSRGFHWIQEQPFNK